MAHSFKARLAQSAERKALNLVVVGSSPTVGAFGSALACNIPARPSAHVSSSFYCISRAFAFCAHPL